MPFAHHVYPEFRLGVVRLLGVVRGEDFSGAVEALVLDPMWGQGYWEAWDARHVGALFVGPADVERVGAFAAGLQEGRGSGRSAVLIGGELEEAFAALAGKRSRLNPSREVRVFRTATEAAHWLGVPAELLEGEGEG